MLSFQPFLISTGAVALAEIGDKTMLLAVVLAARYRAPLPILAGILVATLANHAVAAALGVAVAQAVPEQWMRWIVGASFLAMAVWTLKPDRLDEDEAEAGRAARFGPFLATTVAFFLAEIGDKTQVATVLLAAEFETAVVAVVLGTTLGMMLANGPAVWLGHAMAGRLPLRGIRIGAAALFAGLGVWTLLL